MAKKNKKEFDFEDELDKQREEEAEERAKRRFPLILPLLGCGLPILLIGGLLLAPYVPTVFQKGPAQEGTVRHRTVKVSSVLIEGDEAQPNAQLAVTINGRDRAGVASDGDGDFAFPVELVPGENVIVVSNPDGTPVLTETIVYEVVGPQITITYPSNAQIITDPNVTVTGISDPGATVTVNGDIVATPDPVTEDEDWSAPVVLQDGTNTITAVAENENGTNQDQVTVYVDLDNNPNTPAGDPPPGSNPPGDGSTGSPPGGGGSNPPGDGGGSNPPGDGGGTTPPGGGGSTPPGGGGSNPPGDGSGSTPPDGGGSNPPGDGSTGSPPSGGGTPPGGGGVVIYPSKVIISKVLYNGDTPEGGYSEYIEIRNTGDGDENISSWQVFDTNGNTYTFGSYTMSPGQTIRIGTNQGSPSFAAPGSVWDHMGEPAYLRNSSGNLVDIYSYN